MERILARTLTHTEKHCEVARNRVAGGAYLSFDVANSFHFGALQSAPLEHFSAPFWHRIQNTQSLTHICSAGDPRSRETPSPELPNESQADSHAVCCMHWLPYYANVPTRDALSPANVIDL